MNNRGIYAEDVWSTDGDYLAGLTLLREKFKKAFESDQYYLCAKTLFSWHSDVIHDTPAVDSPHKRDATHQRMTTMNRVIKIILWVYTIIRKHGDNSIPLKDKRNLEWRLQVAYKLLMAETALQGKLLKYKPKRLLGQKTT